MRVRLKDTSILTIVVIIFFTGFLLVGQDSFAKPPDKCSTWPKCDGNGEGEKKSSFDFELSPIDSISINQGGIGILEVTVSSLSGAGMVQLSSAGEPEGVTTYFNPIKEKISSRNPTLTSTLIIFVPYPVSPGDYELTIQASGKGQTKTTLLPLIVIQNDPPDPPPPTSTDPIIVAAGDIACDPDSSSFNGGTGTSTLCHQMHTSDIILGMNPPPDAVLLLGDDQYEDGEYDDFLLSYDLSWGRIKSITNPSPGNHEYQTPGATGYYDYFGSLAGSPLQGYYSYDLGTWHMVSMNSNCSQIGGCGEGSIQLEWLKDDLAQSTANCILAYWHHPKFSSGSHGNNLSYTDFWRVLYQNNADVILVGHDHIYERFAPQDPDGNFDSQGLTQIIVGTGGKSHFPIGTIQPNSLMVNSGTFGVLKMVLQDSSYYWEFLPEAGKTFTDLGTADCNIKSP